MRSASMMGTVTEQRTASMMEKVTGSETVKTKVLSKE